MKTNFSLFYDVWNDLCKQNLCEIIKLTWPIENNSAAMGTT